MPVKRRLMVTGGRGFVAGSVIAQAGAEWEVHVLSRGAALTRGAGVRWHTLDPLAGGLSEVFEEVKPSCVIHLAAMADIDACEADPDAARRANVEFTKALAERCARHGAKLVYASTDNVFDGERGLYAEDDLAAPVNYYGVTKLEAEGVVSERVADGVVARVSLVMGFPVLGSGNSFLSRMIPALEAGEELGVPDREIRSPVDVVTLGRALLELAGGEFRGRIHLAGDDVLNRHAMVRRIAVALGYSADLVAVNDPTSISGRAERPVDVSLDNGKARGMLETPMRGLEEGLELVLAERG